ncbi:MAG: sigma-70 family RNA polymerase sigma factor [Phycisphaerales bacterium]|nr:MAG: sigma-70 family RNA polymerase sigma factor [Phycisphaerales bacterium]
MGAEAEKARQGAIVRDSAMNEAALRALSSEELAWRSREGCRASFGQLVERYAPRLLYFLSRRTSGIHDAEDLVQDTLVRAFENVHRYRKTWKFSTWLFTIAARLATSNYRKKQKAREFSKTSSNDTTCPSTILLRQEERLSLWAQAMELSENQYQVLWLKYAEDMSVKEIARVMGKSQVSVKVLLYRARAGLAQRLQDKLAEKNSLDEVCPERELHKMKTGV